MGQLIEVEHLLLGNVAIFDTDRSLSGQDGETFTDADDAGESETYPGLVAQGILNHDVGIKSVYVFSNTISVSHSSEWTDDRAAAVAEIIRNSLVHYEENRD